jgi:hypothetical protein
MKIRFLVILTFALAPIGAVVLAQQPAQNLVQPQIIKIPMGGGAPSEAMSKWSLIFISHKAMALSLSLFSPTAVLANATNAGI